MSSVTFGPFELDWELRYPSIDCTGYVDVPDWVPFVHGRHKIGSTSIRLDHPEETITIGVTGLSASMTIALRPENCEIQVCAEVTAGTWHDSRETSFQYMRPLRLAPPAWNGDKVNEAAWSNALRNGVPKQMPRGPTQIRNDEITQGALKALFIFVGASTFIEDSIAGAKRIRDALEKSSAKAARPAAARPPPDVLIAIGPNYTLGFGIGLSQGAGVYFSSDDGFGAFGSLGVDVGLIAEITASCAVYVFWSDFFLLAGEKTALQNFSGDNWAINVGADLDVIPASVSFAEFWPANPLETYGQGVGVSASIGVGVGVPVEFYASNSYTWTAPFGGGKEKPVARQKSLAREETGAA